ncbi:MAG: tryptophan--tRNA ligase [Chloroflexota bacterium]|nr:tryptophan--tRNA ligase [Chloroflexota bacterium]
MVVQSRNMVTASPATERKDRRLRVFSGIQPSGNFHLGNYLGAIRNWVKQQDMYENVFCIVDLHALSVSTTREGMRSNIRNLANTILASGIQPEMSTLFVQSHVREHAELCWLLNSVTQYGELRRMTQFKDKSNGQDDSVSAALFDYPVLQAADILLYDTDLVPVGDDQKQHIELTRDIAYRFNARYGDTFVLPAPDIKDNGARIMALDDPTKKMSKSSSNPGSYIALSDEPDVIRKKIKRAVTDSGSEVVIDPAKPALTNLITIYALLTELDPQGVQDHFMGKGYGAFKAELAEVIVTAIQPVQQRLAELEAQPEYVTSLLDRGAETARQQASPKMTHVRDRMGIGSI